DYHDSEDEQFTYDKLGNRENVNLRDGSDQDYVANYSTNRYDNDAGEDIVCDYDNAGNTIVDPNGYKYTYDYENRIIEIKDKDDTSIVEYAYDALGRRIQKDDNIADETTRYYYNNNWQVLTETDDNNDTQRWFIYGNYIDEVLVMVAPGTPDDVYYYAHDHLYSPAALMEDDGDVIERYEYDAYGKMTRFDPDFTEWSGTEAGNPYYFTGRRVDVLDDGDLTLQYSRNRYYDYYTGRWLTHDPLGVVPNALIPNYFIPKQQYLDGINLYIYVNNQTIIKTDHLGTCYDKCIRGSSIITGTKFIFYQAGTQQIIEEYDDDNFAVDEDDDVLDDLLDLCKKYAKKNVPKGKTIGLIAEVIKMIVGTGELYLYGADLDIAVTYDCCIEEKKCRFYSLIVKGECTYYDWDNVDHYMQVRVRKSSQRQEQKRANEDSYGFGGETIEAKAPTQIELLNALNHLRQQVKRDCINRSLYGTGIPKPPKTGRIVPPDPVAVKK
ncbi:RHS repeat domain-containing protein, partial [Planctomycetota bacterium]